MRKRIAGFVASLAVLAAVIVPASASAATVQQTLRQYIAFDYGVAVSRVDVNASPYDTFTGYYCRDNHTEFIFSGDWYGYPGHVGGELTWSEGTTIPCNPNVNQQPFG